MRQTHIQSLTIILKEWGNILVLANLSLIKWSDCVNRVNQSFLVGGYRVNQSFLVGGYNDTWPSCNRLRSKIWLLDWQNVV